MPVMGATKNNPSTQTSNPTQAPMGASKTAYQQFFSDPVQPKWKLGDKPTTYGQALATINNMAQTDPKAAQEKLTLLNQYRTQPGSVWYDPFASATNSAVANLKSYGIDPAELTADWFNQNTSWQAYLSYNGTTTTPSKPGKKATVQEQLAYDLYQYQKSLAATDAAKAEWAAAQDELKYWANRKDLNLSDDEIINKVFGGNKYSTLKKMDDSRTTGAPLELNDAIDYNSDSVRGVIWAARNGGGSGNLRQDIANYYSGFGNNWIANEEIAAKLNKSDLSTYSPHEVGMTGKDMDDVGAYFGVSSFAPGDIDALRKKVDWNDTTSVKMYQKAAEAEETTLKAEKELEELNKAFEKRLNGAGFKDQAAADKWIDEHLKDYPTLSKMDSGLLKGDPVNMTRAVPYRKQMFQQKAAEAIANPKKTGADILDETGTPVSDADKATTKVQNENVTDAVDAMAKYLTTGETEYFDSVPGVEYDAITEALSGTAKDDIQQNAGWQYVKTNGEYTNTVLSAVPTVKQYEKYQSAYANLEANIKAFEEANEKRVLANEDIQSEKIVENDDVYVELYMGTDGKYTVNEYTERMLADAAYDELRKKNPNITWEECFREIQAADQKVCDEENARVEAIRNARAETGEMGLDSPEDIAQYEKDKETLQTLDAWLNTNKKRYDDAIKSVEDMKAKRDAIGQIAARNEGVEYDPSESDYLIQVAASFYDYQPPEVDGNSLIDEIHQDNVGYDQVNEAIEENIAVIKDMQFVMRMLGDNIPDDLKRNMEAAIGDAERQNRVYNAYLVTNEPKFKELAEAGRDETIDMSDISNVKIGNTQKNWFPMMTDEEKDIYFALAARDGVEAADQFYVDLRDDLQERLNVGIENVTRRAAESGWLGRIVSEALAILPAGINALAGGVYAAGVAFGADPEEANILKVGSHLSQAQHNANINEVKNVYGEDTVLGKVLTGVYEIAYNRGNSLVTGKMLGGFMPKVAGDGKIADFINNIFSATPIAISAASDALEDAINRRANPTQQAIIFASTLIAESWTEGIEFGHIEEAGKKLLTKDGITSFLKEYIPNAMSEVIGESANDLIENAADYWVKYINNPEYKTQHDNAVADYMAKDDTLTPEQAEALVHQDEVAGVLHTAIISFFSPGADVVSMAGNTMMTYGAYALEARNYNKNATGKHAKQKSVRDIRLEHEAAEAKAEADRKAAEEAKNNPQPVQPVAEEQTTEAPVQTEAQTEQYPVNGPAESQRRSFAQAMTAYDSGIIMLEEAAGADSTTQAAAVASVINVNDIFSAEAAAAKLNPGMVQAIMIAGMQTNLNKDTLSMGLQFAALGGGECASILNNGVANGLSATEIAGQLAAAVANDAKNKAVLQGVAAGVHSARVNEEFKKLMAKSEAEPAIEAQQKIDEAKEAAKVAEDEFNQKQNELEAARQGVSEAAAAVNADPVNDGNQMTAALSRMTSAAAVAREYQQKKDNAKKNQQTVEAENEKTIETVTAYMRQQAEATVAEQEAVEAQAKAEAEAQAIAAAEQAAAQEAEKNAAEQAEEQKTATTIEEAIRNRLRELGYSDEAIERQMNRIMNRLEEKVRGTEDTNARLSDRDGDKFLRRISRKTGITYEMQDLGDPRKNRGYIVDRNHMVLNSNLTRGQALVEAALHEVTHGIENTKAYKNYSAFVLKAMYGGEGTDKYNKALREKINEYARNGKNLTPEGARQELVAEYARLNLGKKEFARQIATQGLGGKFREILSKAISMLKGYTLDAEGRAKYQEMRTAMKLLNDAINERAQHMKESNNGHTGLVQASITGWTDATGLTLEVTDDDTHVYRLLNNGEEIKPGEYTADMVKGSPVGNLIDMASQANNEALQVKLNKGRITQEEYAAQLNKIAETAKQQREYVAKIINMIGQYQDAAMVWELAGSLAFSSLKTNGDPQYSDSYDFGTICTKTQAILNAISETQVRLGRALTKAEIDGVVYEEVGKGVYNKETGKWEHGATPCPPCYVYATWVNKPARLEKVRVYQDECANWTNEQINEFMNRPDPTAKTRSKAKELKTEQNTKKLWISLCLADEVTNPDTGETTWVRKDNPDICPNEILLDLRRSGEMATQHPGTWTFMQKGGNAQGKAIAPYSDARLGESIVAKAIGAGEANARLLEDERNAENEEYIPQFLNPFLATDVDSRKAAREIFDKAIKKVKAQNLKGGQRWQSWSDFRAEWGSDYLMEMITMQALGSQVQTYTKVVEALDLLASAGFEVNMSLMPHGDGFWHNEDGSIKIDEDGNMMLRFSPVTGINPEAAAEFAKKYGEKGNVQPMVVGISDEHIKAALAGDFITFVIPFHGSGGSVKRLQHLMSLLHEQMKTGNDYTKAQSDEFEHYRTEGEGKSKKKINTNPNWALREAILTGNYDSLNESQKDAIENNPYLNKLYTDRYIDEDSDAFHVFFSKNEAQQIYPYEYWDTNTTLATADINSQRFIEYCQMLGVKPRFSGLEKVEGKGKNAKKIEYANFSGRSVDANGNVTYNPVKGYWKLLIDRSMYNRVYDENGKIIPEKCTYHKPQAVSTADINIGAMPMAANNTVGHSDDQTREITERIIQRLETGSAQNAAAGSAVDLKQNAEALNKAMYEGSDVQNSFTGDLTMADIDTLLEDLTWEELMGDEDADIESEGEAKTVLKTAVQDIRDEFDPTIYNGKLYLKPDTLDFWLSDSGYGSSNPVYSKAYLTTMNPADFLRMSTATESNQRRILDEATPLNSNGNSLDDNAKRQPIQLMVDEAESGWKVNGHEGRHRAIALARAGVNEIPVFIVDSSESGKYMKKPHDEVTLEGQDFYDNVNGNTLDLYDLTPVNNVYRDELFQRFTASDEDRNAAGANDQRVLEYSSLGDMTDSEIDEFLNGLALPLEGTNPSATLPSEGNATRQFGPITAQRSDELDASVLQFLNDNSGYIPDTNESQMNRAIKWIRSNKTNDNSDGLYESVQKIAMDDFDYRSADGQARMIATMGLAVAKDDVFAQVALADAYNRQGTDLGRALQARKLFRLMTPQGRVATLQKMLQNAQAELDAKGRKIDLKFSDWMYLAASAASNEGDFRKVQKRAAEELAAQIPANWHDRVRSLRMLSMLGNPRTHIRNILGNFIFMPAVSIKNKLGAIGELGMKQGEKTKTLRLTVDKSIRDFAKQDAITMKDELTGDSRWNERNMIQREMKSFTGPFAWLQNLMDFNSDLLEAEDWIFLKGHYTRALGGWMQANGYTAQQMQDNAELLEKGRAYAIQEAQKATYRDFNSLAKKLNQLSREGGAVGFVVDAALPFKKTPANILKRGIEYSPVGLAKSLTVNLYNLKQYNDYQNGKLSVLPKRAISPNQFIDNICAGLTGTGIMAVGALLSSLGIVSVGLDDDDDKFDKERGGQEYAFRFRIGDQDVTYTMDWAAPMCMPFFVGAAVYEQVAEEKGEFDVAELLNDFGSIAEPVFNLSMLDGVNTLFKTSQYDNTNTITQIGGKILSNYATSYVPSLLGGIARTVDPVRRQNYVKAGEGSGLLGTFRYALEQTENKIPGLSQQNIAYRNAFGEAEESSLTERLLENFLSPGYFSPVRNEPVIDELERLYNSSDVDDTKKTALVPKQPNKSVSGTALSAEQYDEIRVKRGQTAKNLISELMNTSYYQTASDQEKAGMISDVWIYATTTANNEVLGTKINDSWVMNSRTNPTQGIINRSKDQVASTNKKGWKAEAVQAVKAEDYDALDVCIEALTEMGMKDARSSVKSAISSEYKQAYVTAYQRNDVATMLEIEDNLESTGLFKESDFDRWLDDMEKQISEEEEE